jgi:hypothetical protein
MYRGGKSLVHIGNSYIVLPLGRDGKVIKAVGFVGVTLATRTRSVVLSTATVVFVFK